MSEQIRYAFRVLGLDEIMDTRSGSPYFPEFCQGLQAIFFGFLAVNNKVQAPGGSRFALPKLVNAKLSSLHYFSISLLKPQTTFLNKCWPNLAKVFLNQLKLSQKLVIFTGGN